MADKHWQPFSDDCPRCGCEAEVLTCAEPDAAYDGDDARCSECGLTGSIAVDEFDEPTAYVEWSEYEEESD